MTRSCEGICSGEWVCSSEWICGGEGVCDGKWICSDEGVHGLDGARLNRCVPIRGSLTLRKVRTRPAAIRMYDDTIAIPRLFLAILGRTNHSTISRLRSNVHTHTSKPGEVLRAAHALEQKMLYCPVAGFRACGWDLHFCVDVRLYPNCGIKVALYLQRTALVPRVNLLPM